MSQRIKAMKERYCNQVIGLRSDPKNEDDRNFQNANINNFEDSS